MVERGDIMFEYCPTAKMRADILTKPIGGMDFNKMVRWLLND
jgi:hypothetical protein